MECYGIHPKCWTIENVRNIGEKWGPVLYIDNSVDSLCSLTYARMLVRTKAQNKIDVHIRLLFEHGSCDVWVKENCWYGDKHSKKIVSKKANDASVDEAAVSGLMPNNRVVSPRKIKRAETALDAQILSTHCYQKWQRRSMGMMILRGLIPLW